MNPASFIICQVAFLNLADRPPSASEEGQKVCFDLDAATRHIHSSITYGGHQQANLAELFKIALENSRPNWDGYGALAIDKSTFEMAAKFIAVIPATLPRPEINGSSPGDITFEWAQSSRRIVSASISKDGFVHYAALNGSQQAQGSFPFNGSFNQHLRGLIEEVLS